MNFVVNLFICFAIFSKVTSGGYIGVPQDRIVGGHEAKPYSHPYLVSLQLRFLWLRMHICGGSILNERWILTAAHCVKESFLVRWLPMDAIAGTHDVDNFGWHAQIVSVSKHITHPEYLGNIGPNDIAVLRTRTPFKFTEHVQPINLPHTSEANRSTASLSLPGWGALRTTVFLPDLPSRLQEVQVKYVPYEDISRLIVLFVAEQQHILRILKIPKIAHVVPGIKMHHDINKIIPSTTYDIQLNKRRLTLMLMNDHSYAHTRIPYIAISMNIQKKLRLKAFETSEQIILRTKDFLLREYMESTLECFNAIENLKDDDESNPLDKEANICTGPLTGGIAACNGDSGGPLVQISTIFNDIENEPVNQNYDNYDYNDSQSETNNDRKPVILGVVSWGISPCGEKGAPTVYTKVSRYLDFINKQIR